MPKISAGILLYRKVSGFPEVLLFHPGGPFWAKKDAGAWTIAKGELEKEESIESAAIRELEEESGIVVRGKLVALKSVLQKNNKLVHAFALEQNFDPADLKSNFFELEWPPRSGKHNQYPEVDRAAWYRFPEAKTKILAGQIPLLDEIEKMIKGTTLFTNT
jgi:predicted NUDIX family NTP pyrophosphohydrolase